MLDNDQSVLENHHCFSGFDILFEKGNNFLDGLADGDYKRFRSLVIDCILGALLKCTAPCPLCNLTVAFS